MARLLLWTFERPLLTGVVVAILTALAAARRGQVADRRFHRFHESPCVQGAGSSTSGRVRRGLVVLESLGARSVLLDISVDESEPARDPDAARWVLTTMADRMLGLPREALR